MLLIGAFMDNLKTRASLWQISLISFNEEIFLKLFRRYIPPEQLYFIRPVNPGSMNVKRRINNKI